MCFHPLGWHRTVRACINDYFFFHLGDSHVFFSLSLSPSHPFYFGATFRAQEPPHPLPLPLPAMFVLNLFFFLLSVQKMTKMRYAGYLTKKKKKKWTMKLAHVATTLFQQIFKKKKKKIVRSQNPACPGSPVKKKNLKKKTPFFLPFAIHPVLPIAVVLYTCVSNQTL